MEPTARREPDPPFFSVVVPTCSRPAQLAECLEALASLDYPRDRFEVIVVDDGSSPPLDGADAPFRDRLDVRVLRQENAGPAAARNAGAATARGAILAFTDDDCAPEREWLGALAACFAEAGDRAVVGGSTVNALVDNAFSSTSQSILEVVHDHFGAGDGRAAFFASSNLAVATRVFREARGFDESFRTSEDRELCDRLASEGCPLVFSPDARVRHSHALSLGGFWRQHFHYGRGASRFHATRVRRGAGGLAPDLGFYRKLFLRPFAEMPLPKAIGRATLILVSQLANSAGFAVERLSRAGARRV